jgi:hypothetical protein
MTSRISRLGTDAGTADVDVEKTVEFMKND